MKLKYVLAGLAVALVAAVVATVVTLSLSADTPVAQPGAVIVAPAGQSAPALPACADVFVVGQAIDQTKAAAGCLDPDGARQIPGAFRCGDGGHLWQVDASTGAVSGWGFAGKPYTAAVGEVASDPAYSKAYAACNG